MVGQFVSILNYRHRLGKVMSIRSSREGFIESQRPVGVSA